MSTKAFARDELRELLFNEATETLTLVENRLVDTSRWSLHYRLVFKEGDRYYETTYSQGATEQQDEAPWEYSGAQVVCYEVVPREVPRIVYVRV